MSNLTQVTCECQYLQRLGRVGGSIILFSIIWLQSSCFRVAKDWYLMMIWDFTLGQRLRSTWYCALLQGTVLL